MRESELEQYLLREVALRGGWAPKWVSPGNAGVPDRIVFLPGRVGFLETKGVERGPRPLQLEVMRRIAGLGVPVGWARSHAGVDAFLAAMVSASNQSPPGASRNASEAS